MVSIADRLLNGKEAKTDLKQVGNSAVSQLATYRSRLNQVDLTPSEKAVMVLGSVSAQPPASDNRVVLRVRVMNVGRTTSSDVSVRVHLFGSTTNENQSRLEQLPPASERSVELAINLPPTSDGFYLVELWNGNSLADSLPVSVLPSQIRASAEIANTTAGASAGGVIIVFALMFIAFGGGAVWIISSTSSGSSAAPVLCIVQGNQARPALRLTRAESFIGRDRRNALVLTDPSVSAQHARITRHTNGYAIYDLNSKNGVMVNGKRVTQHLLRDGDRIRIGAQDMLFKQTVPSNTRKG
jgi:pSer/pThr/pTyr-binding forkhead associated (FHA) protein